MREREERGGRETGDVESQQRRRHLSLRHLPPWRATFACLASGRDENLSPSASRTAERRPEGENCTETETRRSATRRERAVGGDDRRRSKKKDDCSRASLVFLPLPLFVELLLTQSSSEAATARSTDRYASACSLRSVSFWAGAMMRRIVSCFFSLFFSSLSRVCQEAREQWQIARRAREREKRERADERRLDRG